MSVNCNSYYNYHDGVSCFLPYTSGSLSIRNYLLFLDHNLLNINLFHDFFALYDIPQYFAQSKGWIKLMDGSRVVQMEIQHLKL